MNLLELVDGPKRKGGTSLLDLVDSPVETKGRSLLDLVEGQHEAPADDRPSIGAGADVLNDALAATPGAESDPDFEEALADSAGLDRLGRRIRESGPVRALLGRSERQRAQVAALRDPTQRPSRFEDEGLAGALVNPYAGSLQRLPEGKTTWEKIRNGVLNASMGLDEGLAAPVGSLSGALGAGESAVAAAAERAAAKLFAADMLGHAPGHVAETVDAVKEGRLQDAIEGGAGALSDLALGAGSARHGFGREFNTGSMGRLGEALHHELEGAGFDPTEAMDPERVFADRSRRERFVPVRPREGTFTYQPTAPIPPAPPAVPSAAEKATEPRARLDVPPPDPTVVPAGRTDTAETITGLDEGLASGMPAEGEEPRGGPAASQAPPPPAPTVSAPPEILSGPESVEEQKARIAAEEARKTQTAARQELADRAAAPLKGGSIDTTGDLFNADAADNPLFASQTPQPQTLKAYVAQRERMAAIPEIPRELVDAIVKEMAPEVIREHTRRHFGEEEAKAVPSTLPTEAEAGMIAKGKAMAEAKGWAWDDVLAKVRDQRGLDADFLDPKSHEAEMLATFRADDERLAERRKRADKQNAELDAQTKPKAADPGAPPPMSDLDVNDLFVFRSWNRSGMKIGKENARRLKALEALAGPGNELRDTERYLTAQVQTLKRGVSDMDPGTIAEADSAIQAARKRLAELGGKPIAVERAALDAPDLSTVEQRTQEEHAAHLAKGLAGRSLAERQDLNALRQRQADGLKLGKREAKRLAELEARDNSNPPERAAEAAMVAHDPAGTITPEEIRQQRKRYDEGIKRGLLDVDGGGDIRLVVAVKPDNDLDPGLRFDVLHTKDGKRVILNDPAGPLPAMAAREFAVQWAIKQDRRVPTNPGEVAPPKVRRVNTARNQDRPHSLVDMLRDGKVRLNLRDIVTAHPDWAPAPGLRKYFRASSGLSWDKFAHEAFINGVLKVEPKDPQEFVEALDVHWQRHKAWGKREKATASDYDLAAKQHTQFADKVLQGKRAAGAPPAAVLGWDAIAEGDRFMADGHRFTVGEVATDEDGNIERVELKDGPKFGEQTVRPEDGELHIDAGTHRPATVVRGGGGNDAFSIGTYAAGQPVSLGSMVAIRPVQSPELVRLAQELGMQVRAGQLGAGKLGVFRGRGAGRIEVDRELFALENIHQLAAVIAHELGHGFDWAPEGTLARGNILGRIATLHDFLRTTLPRNPLQSLDTILMPKDRQAIRRKAEGMVGARPPSDETADLEAWKAEVSRVYREQIVVEIEKRGLVTRDDVHLELWELSQQWRPLEGEVSDSHLAYRMSSKEIYADAISVLLNNPGMLEKEAPDFYELFFGYLDRKPEVKAAYFDLQETLSRGEAAVAQRRMEATMAGYVNAEVALRAALDEDENSVNHPHGFRARLMQEAVDKGAWLGREVDRLRAAGHPISPDLDPRLAWEEANWASAEHGLTADRIHRDVVAPLTSAGVDLHALGQLLQYERIAGGLGARAILQLRLDELGPAGYRRVKAEAQELGRRLARGEARADILAGLDRAGRPADLIDETWQNLLDAGTRGDLANPAAESPESVQAVLRGLEASMTPEQWKALRAAGDAFRQVVYEKMAEGVEHGIINRYTFDTTITANKSWYATFRGLDHVDDHVTPFIVRAKGSLGDVENPFFTTCLKLLSVNNVMLRNRAKLLTRDLLMRHTPESFVAAEMVHDGVSRRPLPPPKGLARLELHDNGIRRYYDVDPYIAGAFEQTTPANVSVLLKSMDWVFKRIYPLIIKYNPAFQLFTNPIRDFSRTARNLRAITGRGGRVALVAEYVRSFSTARDFMRGNLMNPTVRLMMESKALGIPMEGFGQSSGVSLASEGTFGRILEQYHLQTPREQSLVKRLAMVVPHWIARQGAVFEALPKVASFKLLTQPGGWQLDPGHLGPADPRMAAATVRRYLGTPDYNVKGTHGAVHNVLVPFLNIFLQGYRGDFTLATQPTTRGGWWFHYALTSAIRPMLMGLAVAGTFGDKIKEAYAGVSEYDMTNYNVAPIGYQDGGEHGHKVIYMRTPRDETHRVLGAAVYKFTKAAAEAIRGENVAAGRVMSDLASVVKGVVPSPSPVLDLAGAWTDYVRGAPPIDGFRNRPIVPDRAWTAGGWAALKPMLKWSLGKTGLLNIATYNPDTDTTTEAAVGSVPVVKSFLKISDYGYREKEAALDKAKVSDRAQARMEYSEVVRYMAAEHDRLGKLEEDKRTPEQAARFEQLHFWHQDYRKMDEDMIRERDAGNRDAAQGYVELVNQVGAGVKEALDGQRKQGFKYRGPFNP